MLSRAEAETRHHRVRSAMADQGIDALVGFASKDQPGAVRYLTGFEPWCAAGEWALVVITMEGPAQVYTNSPWDVLDGEWTNTPWVEICVGTAWDDPSVRIPSRATETVAHIRSQFWPGLISRGVQKRSGRARTVNGTSLLEGLRAIKTPYEVKRLATANQIAWDALIDARDLIRPGTTERAVAARIAEAIEGRHVVGLSYPTTLMSGPRTACICARPSTTPMEAGQLLQIDCSPIVDGYSADVSWVFPIGDPTGDQKRLLSASRTASASLAATLMPGTDARGMTAAAEEALGTHGLSLLNLYWSVGGSGAFLAHGVGLGNPDPPGVFTTAHTQAPLQQGMVVNVEPIVMIDGVGSARTEAAFLISSESGPPGLLGSESSTRLLPARLDDEWPASL